MAQGSDTFSELSQYTLDRHSMRMLPEPFCRRHSVVVLGKIDAQASDTPVTIGMRDPDNQALRFRISDFLQRAIQPVKLNRYEIDTALRTGFGAGPQTKSELFIRKRPPSRQPPSPVELVDDILAGAIEREASDIHIESYRDDVDLRYRIDGILHQACTDMDPESVQEVISRIKILGVSVVPSPGGEDVVIRVLDSSEGLVPVSKQSPKKVSDDS